MRGPMIAAVTAGGGSRTRAPARSASCPRSSASSPSSLAGVELALVLGHREVVALRAASRRGCCSAASSPLRQRPRQPAAGQRAPRDHAHAVAPADRAAPRARPRGPAASTAAARTRSARGRGARPTHCASTICEGGNVEEPIARTLPARTRSVSAPERLVDVGVQLGAVDLVEVDPVGAAAAEAVLAPPCAIQRRELPNWLGSSPIVPWTLVARTTSSRRPLERLADDLLRLAARVDVGGVDEVDPGVERRGG